jgi:hypothetical protein
MTTVTFPSTPKPNGMSWRLVMPAQTNVSEWTGRRQTLASGRGWWECQLSLPPIVGTANVNAWRSFIAKSRGAANDFRVPVDPTAQYVGSPASVVGSLSLNFTTGLYQTFSEGEAFVNGSGQTGRTINATGFPASTTVLQAGQFVTINDQLLQLTENVTSNSLGVAVLTFEPPIRTSPANYAPIEYANPYCLMYFVEEPTLSVENGYVYSLSLNLRESF